MASDRLLLRDVIGSFAPGQGLRAALLLTYSFDGRWLEEGFVPDLFDRPVTTALVIRDGGALVADAKSVRYHRANAAFSTRIFHPKLGLFVADDRALAVVGSANLTRGGLERNLELASVFEVSPSGGPRPLFQSILDYVAGPLLKEVRGAAETAVRDAAVALREVLADVPTSDDCPHQFLHNYENALWDQVIELLPHRHVARLSIVSPFFEANSQEREDPRQHHDTGLFDRAFSDLTFEPPNGEKPVAVFFQQSEGKTFLPIDKLKARRDQIELWQRLSTTPEEPRPLHGKMLVIEGARGPRREPFLFAVYGSPNFTTAAFLARPPEGNAEVAVVTRLPPRRNGTAKTWSVLQLEHLFGKVVDWETLRYVAPDREPLLPLDAFRLTEVDLSVADRRLEVSWRGACATAAELRVLIELNGSWTVIGKGQFSGRNRMTFNVPEMLGAEDGGLLSIKAAQVRVEMVDAAGSVVASSVAPVNVDCPQQFCGPAMVSQVMSSLDQRIAFAGCGVPLTYREQQKFIEQYRTRESAAGKGPSVLTHQADLDRFFRNLHTGFRGMRLRAEAMPNSEFTFRRTVKDLGRWCQEALAAESKVPTNECQLFLIDRLGGELQRALERGKSNKLLASKLGEVAKEFQLSTALQQAAAWVESLPDSRLETYANDTSRRLEDVSSLLKTLEGT